MKVLDGLRILAVSQYGAGPFGTLFLADLGAEVIKIEDPGSGGDIGRYVPPYAEEGDSLFYQAFNRGKLSVVLNLKHPRGKAAFHRMVRNSDAVFNNLRGDQPEKLGLEYRRLKAINPKVVCCSLTAFGKTGPMRAEPGYDYLIQGMAGLMDLTGDPGGPPTKAGVSMVDFTGGVVAALGLMCGLWQAQRTGEGCDVDVSLLDSGIALLNYLAAWHLNRGYEPRRWPDSAHPSLVPFQNFPTQDGYIVIACPKEKFWDILCQEIGAPELAQDPRFDDFRGRLRHRDALIPLLKERFPSRTTAEWLARLKGKVPCAPVHSVAQALRDEQVLARDMVVEFPHPRWGSVRGVGNPIKVEGAEPDFRAGSPLGADSRRVLMQVGGLSAAEVDELVRLGVTASAG